MNDQYDSVCKDRFDCIEHKVTEMHDRLFIDNGAKSWQTKIDRLGRSVYILTILVAIIAASTAGGALTTVWPFVQQVLHLVFPIL